MTAAVEQLVARPGPLSAATSALGQGFAGDVFMWKLHDDFRDFLYASPAAVIARQVLRSRRINAFYDQLFVKHPGSPHRTPWHEDVSSWPIVGRQVVTLWIACDRCGPSTGALQVIRGSHRWARTLRAVTPNFAERHRPGDLRPLPDVDELGAEHEVLTWDLEPGDMVIFDPHALHASTGNPSTTSRRAFASRWCGEDVRFAPRHSVLPLLWPHGLEPGDPLGGDLFPQILPHCIVGEGERRWQGPEPPDPEATRAFLGAVSFA